MTRIHLKELTIQNAHDALTKGEYSVWDLCSAYLKNIEEKNGELNAYLEVFADVKEQAEAAQEKFKNGTATILTGIPISVKDNILIKGRKASASSKMLEDYTATYDATAIKKLKEHGVVFLGRTNMDEFAMGGSTENSAFGVTKNPHDIERVPGGSSGGAAASVAADMCLIALGSDTGGSIRQPASFCGLVGLKPTYGAVSRYGLMAMASSLDQIGPFAKTPEDAEIIFNAIKGKDLKDSTSTDVPDLSAEAKNKKWTVGVPFDFIKGVDKDVEENFLAHIDGLKKQGIEVRDIKLPSLAYSLSVYYILMPAEVSSNLARFDGVKYGLHKDGKDLIDDYLETRAAGFGPEVRRRIMLGTYVLSSGYYDAYYYKALKVREKIISDLEKAFEEVDFIVMPTSPVPAFKIGEKSGDPLSMYLADIFTVSANIATVPALSIPSGFTERDGKKLPLGVQYTAPYGKDAWLFAISKKAHG